MSSKVLVVGTLSEAADLGARERGGALMVDGWRVVSVRGSFAALDGLHVTEFKATDAAARHPDYPKIAATLTRIQQKFSNVDLAPVIESINEDVQALTGATGRPAPRPFMATRDALAEALREAQVYVSRDYTAADWLTYADTLLASGVVVTPDVYLAPLMELADEWTGKFICDDTDTASEVEVECARRLTALAAPLATPTPATLCGEFIDTGSCGHSDAEHDALADATPTTEEA